MLLGAQLPHQFLNLRRKDFSAPLHSCLGLLFLVTTTPPQLWPPFSSSSGISLPLVYTHISYEFHINFLSNMFASLPLVFVLFLHWFSFHKLIQSFTSVQLNYQTMFWPLTLIFHIFGQELLCFLPCWSLSLMPGKRSLNSPNAYKNLIVVRFLMLLTNIYLFYPCISHPSVSGLCLSCTFWEVGCPFSLCVWPLSVMTTSW